MNAYQSRYGATHPSGTPKGDNAGRLPLFERSLRANGAGHGAHVDAERNQQTRRISSHAQPSIFADDQCRPCCRSWGLPSSRLSQVFVVVLLFLKEHSASPSKKIADCPVLPDEYCMLLRTQEAALFFLVSDRAKFCCGV